MLNMVAPSVHDRVCRPSLSDKGRTSTYGMPALTDWISFRSGSASVAGFRVVRAMNEKPKNETDRS
jgi:hypothetical protein